MTDEPAPAEPIVMVRTYEARPEDLWALWTTKDGFESWWGPQGFRVEVHALEAHVGGPLHYDMIADTAEMVAAMAAVGRPASHETRGRFAELEPMRRLRLVHTIDFLPGVPVYESTIDVDFADLGGSVRMTVTLHPMHAPEMSRMQGEGFASQLTKLDARFASA